MSSFNQKQAHSIPISTFLKYLSFLAILFGILIRTAQYLSNRSLWGDEASLALNIVNRSYTELLRPLEHNQAAPPIFLWIEKLAVQIFGDNEYSLRLFPLIAGIISIFAIYKVGKISVSPVALPIALVLFACLEKPLYYATEVKQYSSDVMVALLLCLLLIPLKDNLLSPKHLFLIGLLGIGAIWLSYPAIFVLGGVEVANLLLTPNKQRKIVLINRLPIYILWIAGFFALYFLNLSGAVQNETLQNAWGPEYPESIFDIGWLIETFVQYFEQPLDLQDIQGIAIVLFLIGCVALFRRNKNQFIILISPILATLVATYFHKYPFRSRLVLFLAPFFILLIAEGAGFLIFQFTNKRWKIVAFVGVIATCLLIFPPFIQASSFLFYPETRHEIRGVVEYVKAHQKPEDGIFLAGGSPDQFEYYAAKNGYSKSMYYVLPYDDFFNPQTFSEQEWNRIRQGSEHLQNKKRVWLIVSGLMKSRKALVEPSLNRIGQKIDYFSQPGSHAYLYELK